MKLVPTAPLSDPSVQTVRQDPGVELPSWFDVGTLERRCARDGRLKQSSFGAGGERGIEEATPKHLGFSESRDLAGFGGPHRAGQETGNSMGGVPPWFIVVHEVEVSPSSSSITFRSPPPRIQG